MKPTKILFGLLMATTLTQDAMASDIIKKDYIKQEEQCIQYINGNLRIIQPGSTWIKQEIKYSYIESDTTVSLLKETLPEVPINKELLFILGASREVNDNLLNIAFEHFIGLLNKDINFNQLNLKKIPDSQISITLDKDPTGLNNDSMNLLKQSIKKHPDQKISDKFYLWANKGFELRMVENNDIKAYFLGLVILRDKPMPKITPIKNLNLHKKQKKHFK